jgi:signal peptidase I
MMGDNRAGSFDSRAWGPVPRENIVGRAFLRLFPLPTIGILPGAFNQ